VPNPDKDPAVSSGGGFGQRVKSVLGQVEGDFSFLKGLAYENKVAAQAQADMTAATQTFAEVSTALAAPLSLQWQLVDNYHKAIVAGTDAKPNGYETTNAHDIYNAYTKAYADLSQNYNLLARKAELYIDLASDLTRNPTPDGTPLSNEVDMSLLNAYGFDCEKDMPSFDRKAKDKNGKEVDDSKIVLTDPTIKKPLTVDWYSAKHHVLAIETCFEITHEAMTPVQQWASGGAVDPAEKTKFDEKNFDVFHGRASNQVLRLNEFMSLAMFDIDKIRIKYRPNGFFCSIPGISATLSLFGKCTPVKTSSPLG
jgi:hypothetical protein